MGGWDGDQTVRCCIDSRLVVPCMSADHTDNTWVPVPHCRVSSKRHCRRSTSAPPVPSSRQRRAGGAPGAPLWSLSIFAYESRAWCVVDHPHMMCLLNFGVPAKFRVAPKFVQQTSVVHTQVCGASGGRRCREPAAGGPGGDQVPGAAGSNAVPGTGDGRGI